jgi:diguanylate cyclase (GGDEF)-like protein
VTAHAHEIDPSLTGVARRRAALLGASVLVLAAVTLGGAWQLWPLFAIPLLAAVPLAGMSGLGATAMAGALVFALLSDQGAGGPELAAGLVAFTAGGALVGGVLARRDAEIRRAHEASFVDRLTGLPNYALFRDALERECRRVDRYGGSLSLALLDLDGFKSFNDRHGHEAGNRLLAAIGSELAATARASDLVARFGGEEFALLVPGDADDAELAAGRMRRAVAGVRVLVDEDEPAGVTVSAGVAQYLPGTGHGGEVTEQADRALYLSKARGRDRVSRLDHPDAPRRRDTGRIRRISAA